MATNYGSEAGNRQAKIAQLIEGIDGIAQQVPVNSRSARYYESIRVQSREWWNLLALKQGCTAPSDETVSLALVHMHARLPEPERKIVEALRQAEVLS